MTFCFAVAVVGHRISRTLKVMGNHVMYDGDAWFLSVIMSSSLALSCSPTVKKQKHDFFFIQCVIKQLLDSVFVISRLNKDSVRVINLRLWLRLITPTSTLIILDITKTSSNNSLLSLTWIFKLRVILQTKLCSSLSVHLTRPVWHAYSFQVCSVTIAKNTCLLRLKVGFLWWLGSTEEHTVSFSYTKGRKGSKYPPTSLIKISTVQVKWLEGKSKLLNENRKLLRMLLYLPL